MCAAVVALIAMLIKNQVRWPSSSGSRPDSLVLYFIALCSLQLRLPCSWDILSSTYMQIHFQVLCSPSHPAFQCWLAVAQAAIQSCPVDCIHWTTQSQLASLEYMTRKKSARVNVGAMMGGAGGPVHDVFSAAERFVKARGKR